MKTKFLTIAIAALTIGLLDSCKKAEPTISVTNVTLDRTALTLSVGNPDVHLTATVAPDNATDKTVSWSSDKTDVAIVDNQGNVHAVAAGSATITVTTTDGKKTATCAVTALPAGALSGEFTVNADGKKVHFSQGNLVATIDATGAPTAWKFAANQYVYLGTGGANKTIGQSAGDVDLFGWSTDASLNNWGIHTKSSSTGDFTTGNFKDWGTAIDDKGTWRTLSIDEWAYLINKDGDNNVRKGKYKCGVTVCEKVSCMVLAPDNFEGTIAESYTAATWATAEAAGLVCLPVAGYRSGDVYNAGYGGYYWSSTYVNNFASFVFLVEFYGGNVYSSDKFAARSSSL